MNRFFGRIAVSLLLLLLTFVVGKLFFSEFDANPDPKARYVIQAVQLKKDLDHFWLDLHLRRVGKENHDLRRPVRLLTADGKKHEAADTKFAGSPEEGFTDIWFKFWLDPSDLESSIKLEINEGRLLVKSSEGFPNLKNQDNIVIQSSNWNKRCLP